MCLLLTDWFVASQATALPLVNTSVGCVSFGFDLHFTRLFRLFSVSCCCRPSSRLFDGHEKAKPSGKKTNSYFEGYHVSMFPAKKTLGFFFNLSVPPVTGTIVFLLHVDRVFFQAPFQKLNFI